MKTASRPVQGTRSRRQAFTLLELILSLALAAVIAGIMGSLIQMFLVNQEKGQDSVRQAQLARAVLNMIAEDIRTTVRFQAFDSSGLQQLLSSGGASGGGGASAGGGAPVGGGGAGAASSGAAGGAPASNSSGGSAGAMSGAASDPSAMTMVSLPPGIYGSSTSLEVDVSRLPRPDEYFPQMGDVTTGAMGDMPSDIKTVGYYVQAPRADGVQDPLAALSQQQSTIAGTSTAPTNGGLVRRSVDRAVTQYAYENGQTDQLLRTGQIIAPEVIAVEFQYFDGSMWLTEWDSSQQGLPHVVKITIAMQRDSFIESNPMTPGVAISSLTSSTLQEYGIDIYSTNTIIPGAQLLVAPQGTTATGSSDNGMGSLGL